MTTEKIKKLPKRELDNFVDNVHGLIANLHGRAASHVPNDIDEMALCEAMVPGEDVPFVRRSAELFGYMRGHYYGNSAVTIVDFPYTNYKLNMNFERNATWFLPGYLQGKSISHSLLNEGFVPLLTPMVEELDTLRKSYVATHEGWSYLRSLCGVDVARAFYLWPVLGTLAREHKLDLAKLPKPRGVPAVTPEVRALLDEGTTFINTVMLMPDFNPVKPGIKITLS